MNLKLLEKLRTELHHIRRNPQGRRPAELEAYAEAVLANYLGQQDGLERGIHTCKKALSDSVEAINDALGHRRVQAFALTKVDQPGPMIYDAAVLNPAV